MRHLSFKHKFAQRVLPIFISTVLLAACGGVEDTVSTNTGQGASINTGQGTSINNTANDDTAGVVLSGSIGDGPVIGATITITDNNGKLLASTTSNDTANYTLTVPGDAAFPVTITATEGIDVVTGAPLDFVMLSVAEDADQSTANINPYSTLIVKTAQAMPGGLNSTNLDIAKQNVLQHLNFGIDATLMPDPITTPVTEQNVANIVKSSEAFAETIRRTTAALLATGTSTNEDQVFDALAADMTDGQFDGVGAQNASPLISATANVVSGQVLIEALSNNLHVNGAWATDLLDNAILVTMPTATETTADVVITAEMINQTKLAIDAAHAAAPSVALTSIAEALDTVSAGSNAADIEPLLPVSMSDDLNDAISDTVFSTTSQLNIINNVANNGSAESTTPAEGTIPAEKLTIVSTQASAYDADRGRVPENAIDGDLQTKWTAYGSQWIVLDLGAYKTIDRIRFNFIGTNNGMNHTYTVATSSDNTNWENQVVNATFDIINSNWTEISLNSTEAKYVRVSFDALNSDDYLNVYEAEVYGSASNKVTLTWNPAPTDTLGYIVYYGTTANDVTNQLLDIPVSANGFDPQAPKTEFDAGNDLTLTSGDNVCFSLRAYNNVGLSEPSPAVCGYI